MGATPRYIASLKSPRVPGFSWQDPDDEGDRKCFRDILEYGCHILTIDDQPATAVFSYSIGFYLNHLHPEIFAIGISRVLGGDLINRLLRDVQDGRQFREDETIENLFSDGRPGLLKAFPKDRYPDFLGYGCWFYRSLTFQPPMMEFKFPVLRVVWPDKEGRYPFEDGCHPAVVAAQRLQQKSV